MKKVLTLLLASALLLSFASCGGNETEDTTADVDTTPAVEETVGDETDAPAEETEAETEAEAPAGDTLASQLYGVFTDKLTESPEATALELAETVITNERILFAGGAVEVVPGYLSGFDNIEVTGFESGAMFCPMIGSIPFVGYVFDLADDADVDAFKKTLTDSANLRWLICATADEMLCESNGDKVFFIMCPTSLEA